MTDDEKILGAIPLPDGEPFIGETLRADGWEYRDLHKTTPENLAKLLSIVGKGNYRWLTYAEYNLPDGKLVRGQMFVSPQGIANCKAWKPMP